MSNEAQALLEQALRLPVSERATLASKLRESFDPPGEDLSPEEWHASWAAELDARAVALDRGDISLQPWEDVKTEMEGWLRKP